MADKEEHAGLHEIVEYPIESADKGGVMLMKKLLADYAEHIGIASELHFEPEATENRVRVRFSSSSKIMGALKEFPEYANRKGKIKVGMRFPSYEQPEHKTQEPLSAQERKELDRLRESYESLSRTSSRLGEERKGYERRIKELETQLVDGQAEILEQAREKIAELERLITSSEIRLETEPGVAREVRFETESDRKTLFGRLQANKEIYEEIRKKREAYLAMAKRADLAFRNAQESLLAPYFYGSAREIDELELVESQSQRGYEETTAEMFVRIAEIEPQKKYSVIISVNPRAESSLSRKILDTFKVSEKALKSAGHRVSCNYNTERPFASLDIEGDVRIGANHKDGSDAIGEVFGSLLGAIDRSLLLKFVYTDFFGEIPAEDK